ncbi:MAG: PhoPQ-activated protein PqaA family protein [Planctomycetota bacterium]
MRAAALLPLLCALLCVAPARAGDSTQAAASPLDRYVKKPQPRYGWEVKSSETRPDGVRWVRLVLTSQEWQGLLWKHRLNLVVPPAATGARARPGHAVLFMTGTGGEGETLLVASTLALRIGAPVAVLHDIPNQPLFKEQTGKKLKEDALIAYTFVRYLETGDEEWPALFPMVRSCMAAMDALGEYSAQQVRAQQAQAAPAGSKDAWAHGKLTKFVTTGGSKRGWTTWLSAVTDPRVVGVAPIVYDNLNVAEQMRLHYQTFGKPSPSIHDYTDAGLIDAMKTPRGRHLMDMVDPFTYRSRITVPKLALIGTNDTYWPLEAIHAYAHEMPGELRCHYVPNAGHGAGLSVIGALAGFFDEVSGRTAKLPDVKMVILPRAKATFEPLEGGARIQKVRLWGSHVVGREFTKSKWVRVDATRLTRGWEAPLPQDTVGDQGRSAYIGELEVLDSARETFTIHTPVQVWDLGPGTQEK